MATLIYDKLLNACLDLNFEFSKVPLILSIFINAKRYYLSKYFIKKSGDDYV